MPPPSGEGPFKPPLKGTFEGGGSDPGSRYKGLVLGSVLVPEIDMILETELELPWFAALIANWVLRFYLEERS